MAFNLGKLLTAGRIVQGKVTFNCQSGRDKGDMNISRFPNVSELELHLVAFQRHWTLKYVAICQAHTAVCLFAWSVGWGAWGIEVMEARMLGTTSSSIICQLYWSEWLPRWNSYIMHFQVPLHSYATHFIPFLGTIQVAVFHNVAIILLTIQTVVVYR